MQELVKFQFYCSFHVKIWKWGVVISAGFAFISEQGGKFIFPFFFIFYLFLKLFMYYSLFYIMRVISA